MDATYQDRALQCRNCGTSFVWTAGEQAFYAAKNLLHAPSRCPACRLAAREGRQPAARSGRPREFFPVVCDRCGVQTQVPFLPRDDRPVYCSSCYDAVRLSRVSAASERY
jgi:CxxC-x17-CxxC domain-containing protein